MQRNYIYLKNNDFREIPNFNVPRNKVLIEPKKTIFAFARSELSILAETVFFGNSYH